MKYKTARAVGDAANQPGGAAAGAAQTGLGLGAGLAAAKAMADTFGASSQAQPAQAPQGAGADDPVAVLRKLKDMLDGGLITQEEYDAKKKEILGRM